MAGILRIRQWFEQRDPWILGALVAGAGLRFINLDAAALWYDEALDTTQRIQLPWSEMLPELFRGGYGANHLPLYFIVLKAWSGLAGLSSTALRLPSVFFSTITIALVAVLGRTLMNQGTARYAAWLTALSPYLLHHGQEARMYGLMGAIATGSLVLLARFVMGHSSILGTGFVVLNLCMLATHYYAVIFVGAQLIVLLVACRSRRRSWMLAGAALVVMTMVVVGLAIFVAGHASGEIYALGWWAFPGVIWSMIAGYTLLPSAEELHASGVRAVLPYLPLALFAIVPLCVCVLRGFNALIENGRVVVSVVLFVTLIGPFVVVQVLRDVSVNPRYFVAGAPALFVLVAAGMSLGKLSTLRRRTSTLALLVVIVTGTVLHLANPGHGRADIHSAGSWIETNVDKNEKILLTSREMASLAKFHWPHRQLQLYPQSRVTVDETNVHDVLAGLPLGDQERIVYVFGRAWLSDPGGVLQQALIDRFDVCADHRVRGLRIMCLYRSRKAALGKGAGGIRDRYASSCSHRH